MYVLWMLRIDCIWQHVWGLWSPPSYLQGMKACWCLHDICRRGIEKLESLERVQNIQNWDRNISQGVHQNTTTWLLWSNKLEDCEEWKCFVCSLFGPHRVLDDICVAIKSYVGNQKNNSKQIIGSNAYQSRAPIGSTDKMNFCGSYVGCVFYINVDPFFHLQILLSCIMTIHLFNFISSQFSFYFFMDLCKLLWIVRCPFSILTLPYLLYHFFNYC